ncbi:S1C family serine protease [Micromonospora lupini]|uniref:Peptidase S1 and S6, chymotrypsin/Hap n=1 Tax=Micromonospora lupini str. Lupac 08 TaxID=1150864 RepID=I0LB98_9ACTN|nr:trypsin-like peptidase domain-containing protein [Micromonospora lupini]CCH21095.1 Peptidase S1 and S6, chymotrypsin/Hap [Micromonospora lupini str. Lupac 08]
MTEFESDPQRRPAPTDAEPSHPTAELPRDERAQSDSPTTPVPVVSTDGDTAPTVATPAVPDGPTASAPHAGQPTGYEPPTAGQPSGYEPPTVAGASAPPYPVSGHPVPGQPGYSGQPAQPSHPGYSGYPQPAAGQYPGAGWHAGQQSGWAGGGQPGAGYPQHPQHQQHHPGQPVPPWGPQATPPGSGPRPGRIAKFAGAGVAVFALMLGSGVAGGALALALDGDNGGVTRTYSAAPVLNSADLPKIAASVQDSVVSIATDSGEGSGVVLTADGYVLTNNHVVASASGDTVQVVFADGNKAQAKIVGTDPKTDLAVVKADGVSNLKPATFGDSDAMQVGDQVLALGSPLGLQGSVTAGILSARDRTIRAGEGGQQQDPNQQSQAVSSISGLLQTDAPINPGNSGGALVNTRGEVIGVNTAIATSGQSTGNIGVGFAIPSNKAKDVAGKLQRGEKVSHPSLGVGVNQAEGGGALVASITTGSPAEKAGLQRGDVVTRFGDKVINDSDDLVGAVQAGKVGDRVEVHFKRNGTEKTATVTLAETS